MNKYNIGLIKIWKINIFIRLGLIMALLIISFASVNSALVNDQKAYYKLDNNLFTDSVGSFNANNSGTTNTSGIILDGRDFNGTGDFISTGTIFNSEISMTYAMWVNPDTVASIQTLYGQYTGTSNNVKNGFDIDTGGQLRFDNSPPSGGFVTSVASLNVGSWSHVIMARNSTHVNFYINGSLDSSNSYTEIYSGGVTTLGIIGARDISGTKFSLLNGQLDEAAFWDRTLSDAEALELFDIQKDGFTDGQYPYAEGATITLNVTEGDILNALNNTFLATTDLTTNLSYNVNGGVETVIFTNANSSNFTVTGIEGTNYLNVTSNLSGILTYKNISYIIDTINPTITNNIPSTINNYEFNGSWFSCSDTNIASCNISINNQNKASGINFTLTVNNNLSYNITAIDLAGNTVIESGSILINPINYFQFNNGTGDIINFTFGGRSDGGTGSVTYTTYSDGLPLGLNTLLFESLGYVSENFSFIINTTNQLNTTFNVTPAQIIVNIFNRETGAVFLLSTDVTIFGLGNLVTSTGQAIFQDFNFVPGDYEVEAVSTGYYTEQQTFTYSGESNAIINLYLLDFTLNNTATLIVPTTDEWDNVLGGVDVRLQEYDSSILGFKQVSQCLSNSNGECQFLIEQSTKSYRIIGTIIINDITYTATNPLEEGTGETFLPIISGGEEILGLDIIRQLKLKISDTLAPATFLGLTITAPLTAPETILSENSTTTVINVPIDFLSSSGLSYTVCFDVFVTSGSRYTSVITPVCTTGASGILPTANVSLNNDFDYEAVITVEFDGVTETFRSYPYPNEKSFAQILLNDALVPNAVMFFWTILLALSMYMRNIGLWCWGAMFLAVTQLGMFANLLVLSSSVIIIIVNGCVLYISKRQVDLQ